MSKKAASQILISELIKQLEKSQAEIYKATSHDSLEEPSASGTPFLDSSQLPEHLAKHIVSMGRLLQRSISQLHEAILFKSSQINELLAFHRQVLKTFLLALDKEEARLGLEPTSLSAPLNLAIHSYYNFINAYVEKYELGELDYHAESWRQLAEQRASQAHRQLALIELQLWNNLYTLTAWNDIKIILRRYKDQSFANINESDKKQLEKLYKKIQDVIMVISPSLDERMVSLFNGLNRNGITGVYDTQGVTRSLYNYARKQRGLAELHDLISHEDSFKRYLGKKASTYAKQKAYYTSLLETELGVGQTAITDVAIQASRIDSLEALSQLIEGKQLDKNAQQALAEKATALQDEAVSNEERTLQVARPVKLTIASHRTLGLSDKLADLYLTQIKIYRGLDKTIVKRLGGLNIQTLVNVSDATSDSSLDIISLAYKRGFQTTESLFQACHALKALSNDSADIGLDEYSRRLQSAIALFDKAESYWNDLHQLPKGVKQIQSLFSGLKLQLENLFLDYCPSHIAKHDVQTTAYQALVTNSIVELEPEELALLQEYMPEAPLFLTTHCVSATEHLAYQTDADASTSVPAQLPSIIRQLSLFDLQLNQFVDNPIYDEEQLNNLDTTRFSMMGMLFHIENAMGLKVGLISGPLLNKLISVTTHAIATKPDISVTEVINKSCQINEALIERLEETSNQEAQRVFDSLGRLEPKIKQLDELIGHIHRVSSYWRTTDAYTQDCDTFRRVYHLTKPLFEEVGLKPLCEQFEKEDKFLIYPSKHPLKRLLTLSNKYRDKLIGVKTTLEWTQSYHAEFKTLINTKKADLLAERTNKLAEHALNQFNLRRDKLLELPTNLIFVHEEFIEALREAIAEKQQEFVRAAVLENDIDKYLDTKFNELYQDFIQLRYDEYQRVEMLHNYCAEFEVHIRKRYTHRDSADIKVSKSETIHGLRAIIDDKHLPVGERYENAKGMIQSAEFQTSLKAEATYKAWSIEWLFDWFSRLINAITGGKSTSEKITGKITTFANNPHVMFQPYQPALTEPPLAAETQTPFVTPVGAS